jgi:hypothetical protein
LRKTVSEVDKMPRPLQQKITTGPGQGAGRPGPPGPPGAGFSAGLDLTGTPSEQAVIGLRTRPLSTDVPNPGDAYVYDGAEWAPAPAGGGGGTIPALSSYLFVDGGTTTLSPDGSIGKPFPTVQQALDIVVATPGSWGIFISPGEYDESLSLSGSGNRVSFHSPAYGLVSLNSGLSWEISSECSVTFRNIVINQIGASDGANVFPNIGTLYLDNSSCNETSSSTYELDMTVAGPNAFAHAVDITGTFTALAPSYVDGILASSVQVQSTLVKESIGSSSGNMILESCQFTNSVSIDMGGYMQSLYMDATTYYWFLESVVTLTGSSVSMVITDTGTTTQVNSYNADFSGYTYTVVPRDVGRCVSISSTGSPVTVVIPNGMPVGCTILFFQSNVQRITITGGLGVSVFASVSDPSWLTTFAAGSVLTAFQETAGEWVVYGDSVGLHTPSPARPTDHDTTFSPSALWQLNETLSDTSGNGFDLAITGGPITQYADIYPSRKGLYLLAGATLAHTTTVPAGLQISGDITVECLVDFTLRNVGRPFFGCDGSVASSTNNRLYGVEFDSSGFPKWTQQHGTQDSTGGAFVCSNMFPPELCHFAVTRISNVVQFYCNGLPLGSPSGTLTAPTGGGSSVFHLGQGATAACEGIVRSLKIIATGLSAAQVKAEYNRCLGTVFWTDP